MHPVTYAWYCQILSDSALRRSNENHNIMPGAAVAASAACYTDYLTCCSYLFAMGFQDSVACSLLLQYMCDHHQTLLISSLYLFSRTIYSILLFDHGFIILCLASGILFRPLAVLLQSCLLLSGGPGMFPLSRSRTSVKCASYHELSHIFIFELFFLAIELSWSSDEIGHDGVEWWSNGSIGGAKSRLSCALVRFTISIINQNSCNWISSLCFVLDILTTPLDGFQSPGSQYSKH